MIVLLLGCCALWVVSYWNIQWASRDGRKVVLLWDGAFIIAGQNYDIGRYGLFTHGYEDLNTIWWPPLVVYTAPNDWSFRCSLWLPTLLLGLPLAISASPWARRRRRAKQGLCIRCAYDLSGTDHTLCPVSQDP